MMLPPHMQAIRRQCDLGLPFFVALRRAEIPTAHKPGLLLIADDRPEPIGSRGPAIFDGRHLRAWMGAADNRRGAIGVFAGAPMPSAYRELAGAARLLPGGAIIIECGEDRYLEWSRLAFEVAPSALRLDVATDAVLEDAKRLTLAEGASPVVLA